MRTIIALVFSISLGGTASAQGPAEDCAALVWLALQDTQITSARVIPASGLVPEYCQVLGGVETVILFEVALPSDFSSQVVVATTGIFPASTTRWPGGTR